MRQRLRSVDVEFAIAILPRQHRGGLAAAISNQYGAVGERAVWTPWRRQGGGGGVRDMVSDEVEVLACVVGQGGSEELRGPGRVGGAQMFPAWVEAA